MTALYTPTRVIVGMAALMTAPEGTALPVDTIANIDIQTGENAWDTPWTYVGATDDGVTYSFERKTQEINIEEQSTPTDVTTDSATLTIEASLAEETLENMKLAHGGGVITTTAPTATTPGVSVLKLSDTTDRLAVAFVGKNSMGFPLVFYVPIMNSVGKVETKFRRAADKRMYPISLNSICAINDVEIRHIDLAPTA